MFCIKNSVREIELRPSSKCYCDLKQRIGAKNLKLAFLKAYDEMDLNFFVDVIMAFSKEKNKDAIFSFLDTCFEEGTTMDDVYTTLVSFAFGMGFFGRVDLNADGKEKMDIQEYMREPMNTLDMTESLVSVMDESMKDMAKAAIQTRNRK